MSDVKNIEYIAKLKLAIEDLLTTIFPVRCPQCGREYKDLRTFLRETSQLVIEDDEKFELSEDQKYISLMGMCSCGEFITYVWENMRDLSQEGIHRRETFGRFLDLLESVGMTREVARKELLKVLQGGHSKKIESLGCDIHFGD